MQKMKASVHLVFPNSPVSVIPEGSTQVAGEPLENGIITSLTQGAMSGMLCTKPSYVPVVVIENVHMFVLCLNFRISVRIVGRGASHQLIKELIMGF